MMHNWEFNHLGMMVTDRDEILSYYQSIGLGVSVGPQPLLPYIEGEGEITFFKELDGEPVTHRFVTGERITSKMVNHKLEIVSLKFIPCDPDPACSLADILRRKVMELIT